MDSGRNDIRLIELKDTISQLNQTIRLQTEMIKDLRKTIEEHHASDEKKDQIISNLQAEISYLKAKLFGTSSEKVNGKSVLPINFLSLDFYPVILFFTFCLQMF